VSLHRFAKPVSKSRAENLLNPGMQHDGVSDTAAGGSGGPSPFSIVCLSSQDWDAPLPTNRQQIMSRAAQRGHRVLFVETSDFLGKHLWRLVRGPRRAVAVRRLVAGVDVAPRVRVSRLVNLLPWSQRFAWCNRINWRIGAALLRRQAASLPGPRILWIYDPRGADAVGLLDESFAVYDCVDDYRHQTGSSRRSQAVVTTLDRAAGSRSRLVFATTPSLLERHAGTGRGAAHLVPNVGDFDHFAPAADRTIARAGLRELPRPVLGFAGNLAGNKVDFALLARLADEFAEGTLLVAGPAERAVLPLLEALAARANVQWLGPQPYASLPEVVAAFDVALIPYADNPYTRNVFPLKAFEYLAAGKPVVASGVPSIAALEPHVRLATGHDAFVAAVRSAVDLGATGADERVALAAQNTWEDRTSRLLGLIADELARGGKR
jgi:glycosyltransferase involved in cell wall biosynthesis